MRHAWILLVAACFKPSPPEGAPCAKGTDCPDPLKCDNGFCVREPVDASGDEIAIDTPDASLTCVQRWQSGQVTTSLSALAVVNSTAGDINPYVTPDGNTFYFASNRAGAMGFDVYRARKMGSSITAITNATDLNSPMDEGALQLSPDGLTAIVATERTGLVALGRNLWQATRGNTGDTFTNFTADAFVNINTDGNEYEIWLSHDLLRLYVSTSTAGEQTIAMATRSSPTGVFATPVLLNELLSAGTECCHSLSSDEKVIVFESNRSGTLEIYYATRPDRTAVFGTPQLVPGIMAATGNDLHTFLAADGCTLYMTSTRNGGMGNYDIYVTGVGN